MQNLIDKKFGRWTVIAATLNTTTNGSILWKCRCDCGTEREVSSYVLTAGKTKSCGCYRREMGVARGRASARHGEGSNGKETPEYRAWCQMRQRCLNSNHKQYADYGGRGLAVCSRWDRYEAFLEDMGRRPSPKLSLDRIDNNKGYSPENCRWANQRTQNRNTRNNRYLTIGAETKTLAEWLEHTGTPRKTFYNRVNTGRTPAEALGLSEHS